MFINSLKFHYVEVDLTFARLQHRERERESGESHKTRARVKISVQPFKDLRQCPWQYHLD